MFDVTHAPRSAQASPARDLQSSLDQAVAESIDYQILRRTLMPDAEPVEPVAVESAEAANVSLDGELPAAATEAVVRAEQTLEQRSLELNVSSEPPKQSDPLVLDLASNGLRTRGLLDAVSFDLDADGRRDRISAPAGDDALLALDRNGNGRIDDGRELFGDQNGAANGFAELARYDDNRDGQIDQLDAVFSRLSLLRFSQDGQQQQISLQQAGVSSISLNSRDTDLALGAYDRIAQLGSFNFSDGRQGLAADLLLAQR